MDQKQRQQHQQNDHDESRRDIMTSGSFCEYEREAFIDGILRIYSHNGMDPIY